MEECVIGRGDCPSQACLAPVLNVQIRQILSQGEQIVSQHALSPCWILHLSLFRLASILEIGQNAPFLHGFELHIDGERYPVGDLTESIDPAGHVIGEENPEEHRRLSGPVLTKRITETHYLRRQRSLDLLDGRCEFSLVHSGLKNGHVL